MTLNMDISHIVASLHNILFIIIPKSIDNPVAQNQDNSIYH